MQHVCTPGACVHIGAHLNPSPRAREPVLPPRCYKVQPWGLYPDQPCAPTHSPSPCTAQAQLHHMQSRASSTLMAMASSPATQPRQAASFLGQVQGTPGKPVQLGWRSSPS